MQVEAAQHQGLVVFVVDLGIKRAQQGRESQPGHLKELIGHPWKIREQALVKSISVYR